jgi:hypothetical protein
LLRRLPIVFFSQAAFPRAFHAPPEFVLSNAYANLQAQVFLTIFIVRHADLPRCCYD